MIKSAKPNIDLKWRHYLIIISLSWSVSAVLEQF